MADSNKKRQSSYVNPKDVEAKLNGIADKSSMMTYGLTGQLDSEAETVRSIVKDTLERTNAKYSERTNGNTINYFNEVNFARAFSETIKDPKKKEKFEKDPEKAFKDFMEGENAGSAEIMLASEGNRILSFSNYAAIYNHIPECAQALDIYKNNIISADDFTKLMFNVKYDDPTNEELQKEINEKLDALIEKYDFENTADKIIGDALLYGEQYVAVLSLEKEIGNMLTDPVMNDGILNESSMRLLDPNTVSVELNKTDVDFEGNSSILEAFNESYQNFESVKDKDGKETLKEINLSEDEAKDAIINMINERVKIGSKKEFLLERYMVEKSLNEEESIVDFIIGKNKKKSNSKDSKKVDKKPTYLNGSCVKVLDPSKVIELKVDNVCYGYYVFEEDLNNDMSGAYGPSSGREVDGTRAPMNVNTIYSPSQNNTRITPDIGKFTSVGMSQAKIELITRVFLNTLSKKLNKDFIRKNKEFKDFLYQIVKQDYILKKGVKITFLNPDEVVAFKVPAVFRKITLFAKLYLATLTNNIIINLGRSHDKRVYYVDVGLDGNYSHAINRVIQDVKTKEFKMSSMNDINTILNLSPGRFDDYFIPQINGNRPIEIDSIPGMNADLNNEFIEFLRKSMLNGTGVSLAMIDASTDVDFARQFTSINTQFVRSVITYQKKLTLPFNKLIRKIYENENQFIEGEVKENKEVMLDRIVCQFPSPATLAMTSMSEQITTVEQNAEFIANTLIQQTAQGERELERLQVKAEIIKDMLPEIDWEKYDKIVSDLKIKQTKDAIKKDKKTIEPEDPFGGGMM